MANPNPEVYGAPNTWIYCKANPNALSSALSRSLKCEKPKIANFGGTDNEYVGSLGRGVAQEHIPFNVPLDATICPCGQDAEVSAFGSYAIINEDNGHSTTPTSIVRRTTPINWFFCDKPGGGSNFETITKRYSSSTGNRMSREQWSPHASGDDATSFSSSNLNAYIVPYTYYGIKTFVLSIVVCSITGYNNNGSPATSWIYLDTWKNEYPDRKICGAAFYVRPAMGINTSTLDITYMSETTASEGTSVGQIAVLENFNVTNDGEVNTNTDFYSMHLSTSAALRRMGILFYITNSVSYRSESQGSSIGVMPAYDMFENQVIKQYQNLSYEHNYFYEIEYSDNNYETIMKMVACFGCYFTPSNKYVFNNEMTDNDLCLPIIDNDGIAHGQYTRGAGNLTNDLYNLDSTRDKNYNPSAAIDDNTYSNQTAFNVIGAGASMNKRYLLDAANVNKLATDLFTICDTMSQNSDYSFFDSKVKANMLTQSPIESIVSLIRYPFTPTHGNTKQTVKLGRFDASAEGYPISNAIQTITFAGKSIFPRFGNCFLDYEPYTKYEVYVPFCDTVELSAADILGHTLNVRLVVDLFTGVCTGYILADSLCIETTTGNVGVNLPLTGLDTATINANIANAEANKKAAKKNYIKGHFDIITQKDKVGALWTQILGTNEDVVKKADYDLKHIETPAHTIGAASPVTAWAMDLNARIMIYYPTGDAVTNDTPPKLRDLTAYAHTTGFATIDNAKLSNYSGLTVATNPILNFAATKTEKELIESALNGGIFI